MSSELEDTQALDPRELQDDESEVLPAAPEAATPDQPKGNTMSFDWSWFKSTGLDAAQHAANTFILIGGGDALDLLHLDYKAVAGLCGGAALVAVLRAVVAYKLPDRSAKAVSVTASTST
ncbi:holin [Mycobacterium intracellulare]|uniref:Uncharacterized protein n=1 Tax=Mycobacterium intracellulare TaxID=1767 RepID=A0A7R7N1M9_MYCIT|nr:holin [Mycobacterium intracellulare]BCP02532.1 hypothetical protein MINTM018_53010 [Mycobacterium intracellulare]